MFAQELKALLCDSLVTSVHCKSCWEMLEGTLVFLYFGCTVNTLLLLSSGEILWNCFRGAFKPLWFEILFLKGSMFEELKPIKRKGKSVPPPTSPDVLRKKHIYLLNTAQKNPEDLLHSKHTEAPHCSSLFWCSMAFSFESAWQFLWFVN